MTPGSATFSLPWGPPRELGASAREQWLAAGEATHVAMLVSLFCGQFLSDKKCDLRPKHLQRFLGMMCDSSTATFRVPQDKLDKLQLLLRTAVDDGQLFSCTPAHRGKMH